MAPPSPAELLFLDQDAVLAAGVLDMRQAMRAVGESLALFAQGECRQPHKVVLRFGESAACEARGRINGLCAYVGGTVQAMGMKWIASFPANRQRGLPRASALVILNSPETGLPLAIMDGTLISAMRTGAVTGLGARFLAPAAAQVAGVVGAGVQAHTQILGLWTALPGLRTIRVVNRCRAHAEALAAECRARWQAPVEAVETIPAALAEADVALTITTAEAPIIFARDIKPGALTIQLSGHECEFEVLAQCQKLVVDDWETVKHRGIMTPALMHQAGLLPDHRIYAGLGELIAGSKPGRTDDRERIHFAHMGMGVDDVALAAAIYRTACTLGLGQPLRLWRQPLWV